MSAEALLTGESALKKSQRQEHRWRARVEGSPGAESAASAFATCGRMALNGNSPPDSSAWRRRRGGAGTTVHATVTRLRCGVSPEPPGQPPREVGNAAHSQPSNAASPRGHPEVPPSVAAAAAAAAAASSAAAADLPGARSFSARVRPVCATQPARDTEALRIRDFATDRALRTILYYMAEFHDQSGREWLLEFDSYGNTYYRPARSFSGSFCAHNYLRNTVDYLSNMMLAPNETMTIIAGPHPRFKSIRREFTFQLEPCRFAQRIMAARESVARELRTDLALIPAENNEILSERLDEQAGHKHVAQRVLDHDENTSDASPLRYQNYQLMKALLTRRAVERFLGRLRFEGRHIEYDWLKLWPDWDTQVQNGDDLVKALLRLGSVTCIGRECVIEGNDRRVVRDGVGLHSEARHEFWPRDFVDELLLLRARIANEWMAHLTPEAIKEEHLQIMRAHLKRTTPDT